MEPPVLEFVVPLQAEVTLGDFKSIQRPYEPKTITDKDIEKVFDDLRNRQAVLEPVDRPAEEGDVVYIRLSGKRTQVEEDQDPVLIQERSTMTLVRPEKAEKSGISAEEAGETEDDESAEPDEWPFPGFSRHLIGLRSDDERTFTHKFSEQSDYESLRGAEAEYQVVVEDVKQRTLPELTDEFAQSIGEYATLEELRSDIRKSLEMQNEDEYNQDYDKAILDQAIEQTTFKYPPQMLESEIESVINGLKNRLERQNLDLDLYLKTREMDMDGLQEEARPVAESRLKKSLFLLELAKAEKIELAPEDVQSETIRTMGSLSQALPKKEARRLENRDVINNLVDNIMVDMMQDKALERFREITSGGLAKKSEEAPTEMSEQEAEAETEALTTDPVEQATESELGAEIETLATDLPEQPSETEIDSAKLIDSAMPSTESQAALEPAGSASEEQAMPEAPQQSASVTTETSES